MATLTPEKIAAIRAEAPENARSRLVDIEEAETVADAQKQTERAKDYISTLREYELIEHTAFKALNGEADKALQDWARAHPDLWWAVKDQ